MEFDDFPAELEKMRAAGNYKLRRVTSTIGVGCWLEWTHHSDEAKKVTNEHFFPRYLPPFEPFNYPSPKWTIPNARFVSGRRIRTWRKNRQLFLETKRQLVNPDGIIPEDRLPVLVARRDALEKQMHREAEHARPYLESILRVIKVWFVETEQAILDREPNRQNADLHSDFLFQTTHLWRDRICAGFPPDNLEGSLDSVLFAYDTPTFLAEAQKSGVLHYARKSEPIFERATETENQRLIYESLILNVLSAGSGTVNLLLEEETLPKRRILTDTPQLLEYAGKLYYDDGGTLPSVWEIICNEAKEHEVNLQLRTWDSFRTTFYKFHRGRSKSDEKGEDHSPS